MTCFTGTPKLKLVSEFHSALRPSLFPNMPPYIRFSSYGVRGKLFVVYIEPFQSTLITYTPI